MKIKFLSALVLIMPLAFAQSLSPVGDLLKGGIADGNKLVRAYTAPLNKAMIYSLGEFNYAGFRRNDDKKFSVGLRTVFLLSPVSDRTYRINDLDLETLEAEDPQHDEAQTVFGDSTSTVRIVSKKKNILTGKPLLSFDSPAGLGYPGVPLPYLSFTYRAKAFYVSGGLIPQVPVPTTSLQVFMLKGTFHYNLAEIAGDLLPEKWEWSAGLSGGFFHGFAPLDIKPDGVTVNATLTGRHNGPYDNQKFLADYLAFSVSTHAAYSPGKHWRLYVGAGYVWGNSTLRLAGTYPVYESDPTHSFSVVAKDIHDPLYIKDNYGQIYGEAGIRIDRKRFYFQLQGNLGHYTGAGLGLGFKIF